MISKKAMLVGAVGTGKTTLIRTLDGDKKEAVKTQSIQFSITSIDTPGEFAENPFYHRALFATSLESRIIILLQDATRQKSIFPPGFAKGFPRPAVGVVTKIDHPDSDESKAIKFLRDAGIGESILSVSAVTGRGIQELKKLINLD